MNIERKLFLAVCLTLLLALAAIGTMTPSISAQTSTSASYCFIAVNPNPIGVGQQAQVSLIMWIPPPTAIATGGDRWQGLKVNITDPTGHVETRGPFASDAVGGGFFIYTPGATGDYKFQLYFPGQHIVGTAQNLFYTFPIDVQYAAAYSNVVTLHVQQEAVTSISIPPLPVDYWTRPINDQNENWWTIANNWLMPGWDTTARQFDQGSCYSPYANPPTSAHVLWTYPLTFGGLVGGEFGTHAFHNGMSYEQFFKPPVIISGRLYWNSIQAEEPTTTAGGAATGVADNESISTISCIDLSTGKDIYTIKGASLAFGQIYDYISFNQGGCFAYLWDTSAGTTWKMYDAWTGNYILSIANVPSGTILLDNTFNVNRGSGDILVYSLDSTAGKLSLWNSSLIFQKLSTPMLGATNNNQTWRIYNWAGQTLDGSLGTMWTRTLADFPAGGSIAVVGYDNTVYVVAGTVTGAFGSTAAFSFPQVSTWVGYSMGDASKLWGPNTIDATGKIPANSTTFPGTFLQGRIVGMGVDKGVLALFVPNTLEWFAWNVTSGQFLWGPSTPYTNPWGLYNYESQIIANSILYNAGYDGLIHAYNAETGQHLWDFSSGNAGTMTPYGTWPFYNGLTVVKGAVIGTTGEHGNGVQPLYEGEGIYVVGEDGVQLWNMTGWFCQPALADGIMVSQNLYDNQIYAFGKGPSTTTVTAPTSNVASGSSIVIQGTVIDDSAGAKKLVDEGKFSLVPAVSDADQTAWMNWIYEQVPPTGNVHGVNVKLTATDQSGHVTNIGTAQSDALGHYSYAWTPSSAGLYTIGATFQGSNSYWGSSAETSIAVGAASGPGISSSPNVSGSPTVTSTPGQTPPGISPTDWTLITVAVVVVIIIITVAAVALSRRRK
jgi:hypothetical protein